MKEADLNSIGPLGRNRKIDAVAVPRCPHRHWSARHQQ
jgi:hypothetical protein